MIKELIAVANDLDAKGFLKEADAMDKIISKAMDNWFTDADEYDDGPEEDLERDKEEALAALRAEIQERSEVLQEALESMNVADSGEFSALAAMVKQIENLKRREEEQSREVYHDAYDRMSAGEQREHDLGNAEQDMLERYRNEY
tara:strand:- start:85 stop:519 length:435 start_codon:yes stop_codon:yes gene_type:complete